MKILALAYSISPVRGSEYSVGWNYAVEMSKAHEVHLLYGLAGDHMGDFEEVKRDLILQTHPNLHLYPIYPSTFCKILNYLNVKGVAPYSFYVAYRLWHKIAYLKAVNLTKSIDFDVVHYVCPIGFREPGYLWKLSKPYVWGPIGGVIPQRVARPIQIGTKAALRVFAKNALTRLQFNTSSRLRNALRRADVVLAATSDTAASLATRYGLTCPVIAENAVRDKTILPPTAPPNASEVFKIIWIGSFDHRKAPGLLIDALRGIKDLEWRATFLGNGPLLDALRAAAADGGIGGRVSFPGHIPRAEVDQTLRSSDIHVVTSMAEGNPTNIWEAMAAGVPTLTIDHCGMHDTICSKCGIKVPFGSAVDMSSVISERLRILIGNKVALKELKSGAHNCAKEHSWTMHAKNLEIFLERAIKNYHGKDIL